MAAKLSELEQDFIDGLKTFPISEVSRVIIYLQLHTDAMKIEMMKYLLQHPNATENQMLAEAERINREHETG